MGFFLSVWLEPHLLPGSDLMTLFQLNGFFLNMNQELRPRRETPTSVEKIKRAGNRRDNKKTSAISKVSREPRRVKKTCTQEEERSKSQPHHQAPPTDLKPVCGLSEKGMRDRTSENTQNTCAAADSGLPGG